MATAGELVSLLECVNRKLKSLENTDLITNILKLSHHHRDMILQFYFYLLTNQRMVTSKLILLSMYTILFLWGELETREKYRYFLAERKRMLAEQQGIDSVKVEDKQFWRPKESFPPSEQCASPLLDVGEAKNGYLRKQSKH